ncbi:MAG: dihydrolipoamide acetyltransferase family protein [Phenylobacterium sp.]|jgi:pyruvate dehydrogenase E2 component (dihydrolipoamide acetyltransferase)|uniref:dihydrolipoamide acetyltransferase family protein n=1 Tax=Phenylobacterium sp. TaxID=1871053 RepID=UPI002A35B453|nr:dihydrolipoamide acetyltransferase family protein [Phenylobacterium sp.]MDX9999163.1 dihydrolipoamide acetyltransferase family protein [Phenylobacterium sp.]
MISFRMPSLGADMEAGTLVEWLAKPGDKVKRGDIVAVVETQKGAIEIEVFDTGVLDRLLVEPGAKVPVGVPLALIRAEGEAPSLAAPAPIGGTAVAAAPAQGPAPTPIKPPAPAPFLPAEPHVRISPAARRVAAERGVDLARVTGTGPGGAIQLADVETAASPARPAGFDFTQMRAAIAAAMARSKREIPHYYLSDAVDLQPAADWLARTNAERPPERRLLMGALFAKATALAARAYPEFNGHFAEGAFRPSAAIHLGVAIAIRGGGLVAPAVHDAADLSLDDLMAAMRDLIGRVRGGRFRSSEIADPTLTVSSLGDRGVEALFGVIYPPQVAIVGFGKAVVRPWAVDGTLAARMIVTITLAADHRVSDGHRGALFLADIGRRLQQPEAL